ncbi:fibrinogen silencer-binding protein [Tachysurus vachellii]|uniref:fibrinogen silencer-binding protein n=1 Tax=Tachysurus vachellii TaxID=175792 RepID=UPI00296B0B4C|nr:fibrinogen silencer-binding protein [Tachysurus vachellii]
MESVWLCNRTSTETHTHARVLQRKTNKPMVKRTQGKKTSEEKEAESKVTKTGLESKMSAVFMTSSLVGKARSSNFTLSEKLDLLRLVQPHIRILEEHTNKHAVIVDKNRCWESIAERYNSLGGERPPRTAQGLRTLYKRLKESAKQEVVQRSHAQPEYRGSISEPTKRIMEMIPHLFHAGDKEHNMLHRLQYKMNSPVEQPGSSSSLPAVPDYTPAARVVRVESEDVKPPPDLKIVVPHDSPVTLTTPHSEQPVAQTEDEVEEEEEEEELVSNVYATSLSPCPSSVHLPLSPSAPMSRPSLYDRGGVLFRNPVVEAESLQMMREEHELLLTNHRKLGQYLDEKREGLKRKQQLEEELLRSKVKVEKLKAARLRHGLPLI